MTVIQHSVLLSWRGNCSGVKITYLNTMLFEMNELF